MKQWQPKPTDVMRVRPDHVLREALMKRQKKDKKIRRLGNPAKRPRRLT